jgi:tetratricopeptide (TPR) repeat protein
MRRPLFLRLIHTAIRLEQMSFARQACLNWLAAFPGDLPANLLYAQILLHEGHPEQALPILTRLCQTDPEYLEAARGRLQAEQALRTQAVAQGKAARKIARGISASPNEARRWVLALGGSLPGNEEISKSATEEDTDHNAWSEQVRQARLVLQAYPAEKQAEADLDKAEAYLLPALASEPSSALVGVTHLRILAAKNPPGESLRTIAEHYRQRWPDCLQFQLILADALMDCGRSEQAVALLHRVSAHDVTGHVATRLWGAAHPYRDLWTEHLELVLEIAIPARVAAVLGWNQLPAESQMAPDRIPAIQKTIKVPIKKGLDRQPPAIEDEPPSKESTQEVRLPLHPNYPTIPETLRSVQVELERVAEHLNKPELARKDGRFPVYVLLTTHSGLCAQYGSQAASVFAKLGQLASTVKSRPDWHAMVFYADEGLPPDVRAARPSDPWSLKLSLTDLDAYLGRQGEMIGAVMIVGGPEVVPFHHLPNPVDDADDYVPSDNPYATRDENYFVPEWPVGRLPGGASGDASGLVALLEALDARHAAIARHGRPPRRNWFLVLLSWLLRKPDLLGLSKHKLPSFGYTAAVWRKASQMVFRPIGEERALRVSPPLIATNPLPSGRLAYFNLHGLVDATEWYGQSEAISADPDAPGNAIGSNSEYPVALRPQDIRNSGHAPEVVFSEACYGAHILGKSVEEAIALKFLQSGSQAVVGSTCTAYGSINTPLTAADYLGHAFWHALKQGSPAGEALCRAKFSLAREMHRRQGYLDGEDQKTLISFVLYGDPLAQPLGQIRQTKGAFHSAVMRPLKPVVGLKTVCDRARSEDQENSIPPELIEQVKGIVKQYLPGMEGAQVVLSHEHSECTMNGHECPTGQLRSKSTSKRPAGGQPDAQPQTPSTEVLATQRSLLILSKEVSGQEHIHHHYARITLDERNRLVKLVVSR